MDIQPDSAIPGGSWAGHILSLFAIGGSFLGLLPLIAAVVASVLAVIWYALEIYQNKIVQGWVRARRLRKLVTLRARAVALELAIRNQDGNLRSLDEANQVHAAASGTAAKLTHEAFKEEIKSNPQD